MAKLKIYAFPDIVLTKKAAPIERVDQSYFKLADDMLETMYAAPGIGLAAPQVGELVRLLVIDTRPTDDNDQVDESRMTELEKAVQYPVIIFNPEIVKSEGVTTYEEGCLSVPGYTEEVQRAKWIEAHGLDKDGKKLIIQTDGLLAICLQHEMDHLEGKLFIDRISFVKSERIKSKIKKYGYPDNDPDDENRSAL
jgi:peptide deformylase